MGEEATEFIVKCGDFELIVEYTGDLRRELKLDGCVVYERLLGS